MRVSRNTAFWISVAAGSAAAFAIYRWRAARRRPRYALPQDRGQYIGWRFDNRFHVLPTGKTLRVELSSPAIVHWTTDQWDHARDTRTVEVDQGLHVADLPTEDLPAGARVQLTFYWPQAGRWEGEDFEVRIEESAQYSVGPLAGGA